MATAAVWPPWNAVEGPRPERRSDDPQNRYLDRFTFGLTADEAARMKAIEALISSDLQAFAPIPVLLQEPIVCAALAQVSSRARFLVRCDLPIRYRPEMWIEDDNGLWRKRRNGERQTLCRQMAAAALCHELRTKDKVHNPVRKQSKPSGEHE